MATLTIPQTIASRAHALSVRCTSNRRYAVVQLVANQTKTHRGNYRPKVLFRSDNPRTVAARVRQLGGYSYVFDNATGELLWNDTSSEWLVCESTLINRRKV